MKIETTLTFLLGVYRACILEASYDTVTKATIPTGIATAMVWRANLYIDIPPKCTGSGRSNACLSVVGRLYMGIIIYSFNLNISPKMSEGVLECDIVMLQNYMLMIL